MALADYEVSPVPEPPSLGDEFARPADDFIGPPESEVAEPEVAEPPQSAAAWARGAIRAETDQANFRLIQNVGKRHGTSPDAVAAANALAGRAGVTPQQALADPDGIAKATDLRDLRDMDLARTSPVLAAMMQDDTFSGLARDDVKHLTSLERVFRDVSEQWEAGQREVELGRTGRQARLAMIAGDAAGEAEKAAEYEAAQLEIEDLSNQNTILGGTARVLGGLALTIPEAIVAGTGSAMLVGMASLTTGPAAPFVALPSMPVAFGAGFTTSIMSQTYRSESGSSYMDMRKAGVDEDTAAIASDVVGLAVGGLDTLGLSSLAGIGVKNLAKKAFAKVLAEEIPKALAERTVKQAMKFGGTQYAKGYLNEVLTETAQTLVAEAGKAGALASQGEDNDFASQEGVERVARLLADTFARTAKSVALIAAVGPGIQLRSDVKAARRAAAVQPFINKLMALGQAGKLQQRSMAHSEAATAAMAAGSPIETVYIDSQVMVDVLNQSGLTDPEIEAAMPGVLAQLTAGLGTGDVHMPVATLMGRASTTPLAAALANHIRFDPTHLSMAEAVVVQAEEAKMLTAAQEGAKEKAEKAKRRAKSLAAVEKEIVTRINATGTVSRPEARLAAKLIAGFFESQAQQHGMTVEELFADSPYLIEQTVAAMPGEAEAAAMLKQASKIAKEDRETVRAGLAKAFAQADEAGRAGKLATVVEILGDVNEYKANYPSQDGWAVPTLTKVTFDDKGKHELQWKKLVYGFEQLPDKNKKNSAAGNAPAMAALVHQEVADVFARSLSTRPEDAKDAAAAKEIIDQATWYAGMRKRLFHEFGGLAHLFIDLLGALSPKTNVRENWGNAILALRLATNGQYDDMIAGWTEWADSIESAEADLDNWFKARMADGQTKTAIKATEYFQDAYAALALLRKLPEELNPKKPNGKKFGANGKLVVRVMVDLWRTVKSANADIGRSGQAPKANTFSGNLAGFRKGSTIDVWAARLLQRLAGLLRLPPKTEGAVAGEMNADGTTSGQFGFGQEVFHLASKLVRDDVVLQTDPLLGKMQDDDLQAVAWFVEKEVWARNRWTTGEGAGGSFEFESDLEGQSDKSLVSQLRSVITSTTWTTAAERTLATEELERLDAELETLKTELASIAPKRPAKGEKPERVPAAVNKRLQTLREAIAENRSAASRQKRTLQKRTQEENDARVEAAKAALVPLYRTVDRYLISLSVEKAASLQGIDRVPTDADMALAGTRLMAALKQADPASNAMSKLVSTVGSYDGRLIRSLDIELVVPQGFDPSLLWREALVIAGEADQDLVILSRVLRAGEQIDYTRHLPGIELYFHGPADIAVMQPMLDKVAALGFDGWTASVDARRTEDVITGGMGKVVGGRFQLAPPAEWAGLTAEQLAEEVKKQADVLLAFVNDSIAATSGIAAADVKWYETETAWQNEYEEKISGIDARGISSGQAGQIAQAAAWSGLSIEEQLASAARWFAARAGRGVAPGGAGNVSGQLGAQGQGQAIEASARRLRLAAAAIIGDWRPGDPAAFVAALRASPAAATLTQVTVEQVEAGIASGKTRLFRLAGDANVWFALKQENPADDYGIPVASLGANEWALTSVINDDPDARGIGGPAVLLKAIAEGATVLDCFAVVSPKYPIGFLPWFYRQFGFEIVGGVDFNPDFWEKEPQAAAEAYWATDEGWDKKLPRVEVMQWEGDNARRRSFTSRYLSGGLEPGVTRGVEANVRTSSADVSADAGGPVGEATATDQGRADRDQGGAGRGVPGDLQPGERDAPAAPAATTLEQLGRHIARLPNAEARAAGISTADWNAVRELVGYRDPADTRTDAGGLDTGDAADPAFGVPAEGFVEPKKTRTAYKLFRTLKKFPGQLFPLFIGKTDPVPVGEWIEAKFLQTTGFAARGGWHAGVLPSAPHLMKKDGTMPSDRVWAEVEIPDDVDWQSRADATATGDIRDGVPVGGNYTFKRPGLQGGSWIIGGALKVVRVLSPDQVTEILRAAPAEDAEGFVEPKKSGTKVYRAADDDYVGHGFSFSSDLDDAAAYLDNPNFGGRTMHVGTIPASHRILDLDTEDPWKTLSDAVGEKVESATGMMSQDLQLIPRQLEEIAAAGYDWVKYRDDYPEGSLTFTAVSPRAEDIEVEALLNSPGVGDAKGPRAGFSRRLMKAFLFDGADVSSIVHESGHMFLEVLFALAAKPDAPSRTVEQAAALLDWFGLADRAAWDALGADGQRKHHEAFAYNYEIYLFEGKSPSVQLESVFRRFTRLLARIYKSIRDDLGDLYRKEFGTELPALTPEVRAVMGQLLATEEQIEFAESGRNMEPLFLTQEQSGLSAEAWQEYQAAAAEATDVSVAAFLRSSLRAMHWLTGAKNRVLKRLQQERKAERGRLRDTVEAEMRVTPTYRAMEWLKAGTMETEDGEQISAMFGNKLSIEAVKALFPQSPNASIVPPDIAKLGYGRSGMLAKEGLSPDLVAEMFDFVGGGREMVLALLEAPDLEDAVNAETDRQMLALHGPFDPQATIEAALHGEARTKFVAVELRAMERATAPTRVMLRAAKQAATKLIAGTAIGAIVPHNFGMAAARAAKAAAKSMSTGDLAGAIKSKRGQLLQSAMVQEATAARAEIAKSLRQFKKFLRPDAKLAKGRKLELIMAGRAILSWYGLGKKGNGHPMEAVKGLLAYNPELFAGIEPMIVAAIQGNPQKVKELTLDQFRALSDALDSLWEMSRKDGEITLEDGTVKLDVVLEDLTARIQEIGVPSIMPGERSAPTPADRRRRALLGFAAQNRRIEHWADAIDGTAGPGAFTRFIWRRVSNAVTAYKAQSKTYIGRYRDMLRKVDMPHGKIFAPELNYVFGSGNGGFGKTELIGALLHTGNRSNYRKLLLATTRPWATQAEDGTMDTGQWDGFLARMIDSGHITEADMDFVQSVWDLLEEIKPILQRAHFGLYGHYFEEVVATPVETEWGTYRGGYVPAGTDKFMVRDAEMYGKMDELEGDARQMLPTTGTGFTKSRVEKYTEALSLDAGLMVAHIDKVLRFAHIQPAIRDVLKILRNREFSALLSRYDHTIIENALIPWLARSAQQMTTTKGANESVDRFLTTLRVNTGLGAMVGNLSNAMQNITGWFPAMTKIKRGHLRRAVMEFMQRPKELAAEVSELSVFMEDRLSGQIFEMQSEIRDLLANPTKYQRAQIAAQKHGYFLQSAIQNIVDVSAWWASYNQALADLGAEVSDKAAEREAVQRADAVVRMTQGSLAPQDVSAIEVGTPAHRALLQFFSYFNMIGNLQAGEQAKILRSLGWKKGWSAMARQYLVGMAATAIVSDAIRRTLIGAWDDEDDDGYLDEVAEWLFGSQVRFALAVVPLGGMATGLATAGFTDAPYDDRISTPPAASALEAATIGASKSLVAAWDSDKHVSGRNVRDLLTLLGLLTGLPFPLVGRPASYLTDVEAGRVRPTGTIDMMRGAVTGSASEGSRAAQ